MQYGIHQGDSVHGVAPFVSIPRPLGPTEWVLSVARGRDSLSLSCGLPLNGKVTYQHE